MEGMEVTIVHELDLCTDECKWLVTGNRPPYCYLFGALAGTRENGIFRARECVRCATDAPEDAS